MSELKLTNTIISGLSWSLISRLASNLSQLLIYFVLARILEPSDFGIMASLTVFINLSNMFATAGLGNANIQDSSESNLRFSTIFYLSLTISCVLYLLIFLIAPFLAGVLNISSEFESLLRIYGLTIVLTVINAMQMSELSRNLAFKQIFYCSTIPSIIAGIVSIIMAYAGFGIYALIVNVALAMLLGILICTIFFVPIPKFNFSINLAKKSLTYSGNLFFASLIDELYKSAIIISIGKFYSASMLGYYNLAKQIPTFIASTINATIASVFFPVFSALQKDVKLGRKLLRSSIRSLNFLVFPLLSLTILLAEDLVVLLLTEKWLPSVIYIQYLALTVGIHHIYANSSYLINALGHSSVTLRYALINKFIGFIILAFTIRMGLIEIVIGQLLVVCLSIIFNAFPNKRYIGYSYKEQLGDILPILVLNIILCSIFLRINIELNSQLLEITIISLTYLTLYALLVFLMRFRVINDLAKLLKN